MITDKDKQAIEEHYVLTDAGEMLVAAQREIAALKAKIERAKHHLEHGLNGYTGFSLTSQQKTFLASHAGNALKELIQ